MYMQMLDIHQKYQKSDFIFDILIFSKNHDIFQPWQWPTTTGKNGNRIKMQLKDVLHWLSPLKILTVSS